MALVNQNIALAGVPMQVPNFLGMQQTAADTQNTLARTGIMQEEAARESKSAEYNTALARSKDALRFVNTPEQYMAWTDASFSDPVLGSQLSRLGLTPDSVKSSALKQFQQPGGFQNVMQMSAANIDQLAGIMGDRASDMAKQQQTAAANARKAAQAAQQQANLQALMSGQPTPQGGVANALVPAAGVQAAPVNALMGTAPQATGAPAASVTPMAAPAAAPVPAVSAADEQRNRIIRLREAAAMGMPGAKEAAEQLEKALELSEPGRKDATPASIQEYNLARSQGYKGTFQAWEDASAERTNWSQPVELAFIDENGNQQIGMYSVNAVTNVVRPIGATPLTGTVEVNEIIAAPVTPEVQAAVQQAAVEQGVTPATPAQQDGFTKAPTVSERATAKKAEKGAETVGKVTSTLFDKYRELDKLKAIPSTARGALSNIQSYGAAVVPQAGRALGTKEQALRDSIMQIRPLLLQGIKEATGMSAQQMNSNVELQLYLAAATDPTISLQSNIDALNNLSQLFGTGEVFALPSQDADLTKLFNDADQIISGGQ